MKYTIDLKQRLYEDTSYPFMRRSEFWDINPVGIHADYYWFHARLHISVQKEAYLFTQPQRLPSEHRFFFPDMDLMRKIIDLYFQHWNTALPLLHRPSFLDSVAAGLHYRDHGFAKVLLGVCAIGARYSDDPRVLSGVSTQRDAGWSFFEQLHIESLLLLTAPRLYDLQVYAVSCAGETI
jgi:hypothetical protein